MKIYTNSGECREAIYTEYRGQTGIYLWHNNINGHQYVGSGVDVSMRLRSYFQPSYLAGKNITSLINKAILKYGHDHFSVVILEIVGVRGEVEKDLYLAREQYYIDLLKPYYNILTKSDSSLGFKHSEETKAKLSKDRRGSNNPMHGKVFSPKFLEYQKKDKRGSNNPMFGKTQSPETLKKISKPVYMYDAKDKKLIKLFPGREIARVEMKMGNAT